MVERSFTIWNMYKIILPLSVLYSTKPHLSVVPTYAVQHGYGSESYSPNDSQCTWSCRERTAQLYHCRHAHACTCRQLHTQAHVAGWVAILVIKKVLG